MKKESIIREGFYFTDGEKLIQIAGEVPNRPEFIKATTEDLEEIRIRKEKLYKVRLNEAWIKDFGFSEGGSVFQDDQINSVIRKSGPSYHILEKTGTEQRRKSLISVDELQNYLFEKTGKVPVK